jgi:hypothetical protein
VVVRTATIALAPRSLPRCSAAAFSSAVARLLGHSPRAKGYSPSRG